MYTPLLVYADVNILGGSMHTIKKNTEALVVVSKQTELELNADKTKYMVTSQDQNAGRRHSITTDDVPLNGWKSSDIWEQP